MQNANLSVPSPSPPELFPISRWLVDIVHAFAHSLRYLPSTSRVSAECSRAPVKTTTTATTTVDIGRCDGAAQTAPHHPPDRPTHLGSGGSQCGAVFTLYCINIHMHAYSLRRRRRPTVRPANERRCTCVRETACVPVCEGDGPSPGKG